MTAPARRLVKIAPGAQLDHRDELWQDAIVIVVTGSLDVLCAKGEWHRFRVGDVLTLGRLPLRCVRNAGTTQTQLLALHR